MEARGIFSSLCVMLLFQGCSRLSAEKNLDEKLAIEPTISNQQDLEAETKQLLEISTSVSVDKKIKLKSLRENTLAHLGDLRSESLKLRALLIKDLLADEFEPDEIQLLKNKVVKVEDERLSVFFVAVSQANVILGRWPSKEVRLGVKFENEQQFPPR